MTSKTSESHADTALRMTGFHLDQVMFAGIHCKLWGTLSSDVRLRAFEPFFPAKFPSVFVVCSASFSSLGPANVTCWSSRGDSSEVLLWEPGKALISPGARMRSEFWACCEPNMTGDGRLLGECEAGGGIMSA